MLELVITITLSKAAYRVHQPTVGGGISVAECEAPGVLRAAE